MMQRIKSLHALPISAQPSLASDLVTRRDLTRPVVGVKIKSKGLRERGLLPFRHRIHIPTQHSVPSTPRGDRARYVPEIYDYVIIV